MQWPWMRRRTADRAHCPACDGTVHTRLQTAWNIGGSGAQVHADKAGEVVRCCQCGHAFTVLASGQIVRIRAREAPAPPRPTGRTGGVGDGPWRGLDADIETLATD